MCCIVLCLAEITALLCYMDIVAKFYCTLNRVKHCIYTTEMLLTCNLQFSLGSFVSSVLMY